MTRDEAISLTRTFRDMRVSRFRFDGLEVEFGPEVPAAEPEPSDEDMLYASSPVVRRRAPAEDE